MKEGYDEIIGHLDIKIADCEDEFEKWQEVLTHGDPDGLRSLLKICIQLADCNQDQLENLPNGCREHTTLNNVWDLGKHSNQTVIERLET